MQKILLRTVAAIGLCLPEAVAAFDASGTAVYPVLKLMVYSGDTITEEMVAMKTAAQLGGLGPIVTDRRSLIGKAARRTLLPGQPIPRNALREPYAVLQGRTVPLIFQSGNITITGLALALESGSAGEVISARNPDSGVVIRGLIQADGSLRAQ